MKTTTYPSIRNAFNQIFLLLFLNITSGILVAIIINFNQNIYSELIENIAISITTILSYLIVFTIIQKKSQIYIRPLVNTTQLNTEVILSFLITLFGCMIIFSEIENVLNFILPMPEFLVTLFDNLMSQKNIIYSFIYISIIAPLFEEILFRGFIFKGFLRNFSPTKSILASSFLFGFVHLNPWQFTTAFLIGIFFAWIMLKTNSLLLPLLGHFLNNFIITFATRYPDVLTIPGFNTNFDSTTIFQPIWLDLLGVTLILSGLYFLFKIFSKRSLILDADPV